jgi:hypothetical protein
VFESKMSLDVVGNRLLYHVESVHRATLDALEQQVGDAVRVVAFITVEGEAALTALGSVLPSQRSLAALGSYQDTGANHEQSELGPSR